MVCRRWWWFTSHYNVAPIFYWYDQKYETPTAAQALCIFPCICREAYHACRKKTGKRKKRKTNEKQMKNKLLICQLNGKLLHYIINTQYSYNFFPRESMHFYWWGAFAFNKVTARTSLPPSWIAESRKHLLFSQACVACQLHSSPTLESNCIIWLKAKQQLWERSVSQRNTELTIVGNSNIGICLLGAWYV